MYSEAVRSFAALRRGEQWQLMRICDEICERPFQNDDQVQDISGKWLYLRGHGPFVVSYYDDFPINRLMIVAVQKIRPRW